MMAVGIPIERAEKICLQTRNEYHDSSAVVIAAVNGPTRYLFFFLSVYCRLNLSF